MDKHESRSSSGSTPRMRESNRALKTPDDKTKIRRSNKIVSEDLSSKVSLKKWEITLTTE